MAKKFTPWFNPDQEPARKGAYQVESRSPQAVYQHWNGKVWGPRTLSPKNATRWAGVQSSLSPYPRWRGLAADPKVAA